MLVLERKDNEFITITTPSGETIEICLFESTKGRAKIGITAPQSYTITRTPEMEIN